MPFGKPAVSPPQMNVRLMWRHSDHECRLSDADRKYVLCERVTYVDT